MNHHDIRLIEIGQKEGYAKAVKEIVAWLREDGGAEYYDGTTIAADIETKFGADNGQRHKD